ncbi:FixH family protein [Solirhodobacter olei]|jgi:nitrogen fixation protein FixH|uniref:FixH family protein n=1 Tax=Solirhodobacter olei TaxID=2493082 RepID=UPI000FDB269C|nr:FixH family protein [Solirhodobacter olei]
MGKLTGRKVLAIAIFWVAVVFGVNFTMAYQAEKSFPGLEEETGNGYDESQAFDQIMKAQIALGWKIDLAYAGKALKVTFQGTRGQVPQVAAMDLLIGRPTEAKDDQRPIFAQDGPVFVARPVTLAPGKWMVKINARAKDGTEFHQRLALIVAE